MTKRQDEKDAQAAAAATHEQEIARQRAEESRRKAEMEKAAKQREEQEKTRKTELEKAKAPEVPEAPKPPPVFSVASQPPTDLSREDGEPLGDIPAPWVYTIVVLDGSIGGALMADADAEWLDVGPHHLRVEMIPVPSLPRGVPVVFLPPAMIAEIADPKVNPPDVFSGQTGLAGTAHECLMRNYHNRPDGDPKAPKAAKGKIARRVVYADPDKPAPAKPSQKVTDAA